jgi:hypothetical protein
MDRYSHPRRRSLDGRSAEARRRKLVLRDLALELGGDLSAGQKIVMLQLDVKLAALDTLRSHIEKQASLIGEDGDLHPALRRAFLGYSNSVARDVALLFGLQDGRKKKTPDLASYLAQRKQGAK